jgi:glyoxylase-like metal-dependent hydrolase (beta-lactamase superfamily II)
MRKPKSGFWGARVRYSSEGAKAHPGAARTFFRPRSTCHHQEFVVVNIADNVFLVADVIANPYLIVDVDGLTLIDTGLPRSHGKILVYVAGLRRSARDVRRIILTRSDLDRGGSFAQANTV